MRLRHRLIRWLSFGDFILMNAQIDSGSILRSINAGPMVIANIDAWCWDKSYAIGIGANHMNAGVQVRPYGNQGLTIQDCYFNGDDLACRAAFASERKP